METAYRLYMYLPPIRPHNIKVSRVKVLLRGIRTELLLLVECQKLDLLSIVQGNVIPLWIPNQTVRNIIIQYYTYIHIHN